MLSFGLISIFVVFASAETPPGFTLNVTAHLDVIYPSAAITPGLPMSKTSSHILAKDVVLDLTL
jgi:hypothetical protein